MNRSSSPPSTAVPYAPMPQNVPVADMIGEAVCIWWSNLSREQRVWVYNTALAAACDLANEPALPPLAKDSDDPAHTDGVS